MSLLESQALFPYAFFRLALGGILKLYVDKQKRQINICRVRSRVLHDNRLCYKVGKCFATYPIGQLTLG